MRDSGGTGPRPAGQATPQLRSGGAGRSSGGWGAAPERALGTPSPGSALSRRRERGRGDPVSRRFRPRSPALRPGRLVRFGGAFAPIGGACGRVTPAAIAPGRASLRGGAGWSPFTQRLRLPLGPHVRLHRPPLGAGVRGPASPELPCEAGLGGPPCSLSGPPTHTRAGPGPLGRAGAPGGSPRGRGAALTPDRGPRGADSCPQDSGSGPLFDQRFPGRGPPSPAGTPPPCGPCAPGEPAPTLYVHYSLYFCSFAPRLPDAHLFCTQTEVLSAPGVGDPEPRAASDLQP